MGKYEQKNYFLYELHTAHAMDWQETEKVERKQNSDQI